MDLKGSLFSYPETDEQYPTQWSEQRAVLMQLMANPDPRLQAVLGDPSNLGLLKRLIGLDELVIPDEESRTKQYREIAQLLQEQPIVVSAHNDLATNNRAALKGSGLPAQAGFSPDLAPDVHKGLGGPEGRPYSTSNAPSLPVETPLAVPEGVASSAPANANEKILSSILPDEFADNHAVELDACKRWFSSDAGQVAKIESPAGYANVRAHAQLHEQFLRQAALADKQQLEATTLAQPAQPGATKSSRI